MSVARGKPAARPAKAAKTAKTTRAPAPAKAPPKPAAAPVRAKAPVSPPPKAPPPRVPPKPLATSVQKGVNASGATARNPASPQLRVGDDLPPFQRGPVSRVDIARYAGASGTWNPISLDEPHARSVNLPSVVVPGGLVFGLASTAVARWLRDEGRVLRIGARAVKMAWPGDLLTARGRVAELRSVPEGREIDLDVWVENQKGELVLRGLATCRVYAPALADLRYDEPVPSVRPAPAPAAAPRLVPPPPRPGRR